ncbi:MAG: molecular chaperone [Halieaceae bacterium]|jgi:fimbrial chaperone protein|nr:molecular chaperone [Halieaceae bacterium]
MINATNWIKLLVVCLIPLFAMDLWAQPTARMGVSPQRYEIDFDQGGSDTQALLIHNMSNEPLTIRLSAGNWDLDQNNQVVMIPPAEKTLDQWLVINPLRVTIPPNSPQTIRWAVMPRAIPEEGEYRTMIFIEEDLPGRSAGDQPAMRMKMRFGLPVYAQVGERRQSAQLHQIAATDDGRQVQFEITNTGNSHLRLAGNYGIWPTRDFPGNENALDALRALDSRDKEQSEFAVGALPPTVLLPGSRRTIAFTPDADTDGPFTVQLDGSFAQLQLTESIAMKTPVDSTGMAIAAN